MNQTTTLAYNPLGDVASLTDPNGNVTASTYDADRRLTQVTAPPAPFPLVTAYSYDPDGRLIGTTQSANDAVLAATSAAFTASGRLSTAIDANGNVTRYAYDAADRLAQATDAAGRVTTYSYDAMSRLLAVSNPAIQANPLTQRAYTPDGLLGSLTIARSNTIADTTSFAYDGFDRLSATTFPDNSAESLSGARPRAGRRLDPWDANGNVLTRQTRRGDTTLTSGTFQYTARRFDPETAGSTSQPSGLYYYRSSGETILNR